MTQRDAVDPLAVLPACSAQARGGRPNGRVTGVGSTIIAPLLSEHDGGHSRVHRQVRKAHRNGV